jgi:hypothetical protein
MKILHRGNLKTFLFRSLKYLYFLFEVHSAWIHCTENSKHTFPEKKLSGLVSNFYIHVKKLENWKHYNSNCSLRIWRIRKNCGKSTKIEQI